MNWLSKLWNNSDELDGNEIKEIFPFNIVKDIFIRADIKHTYHKILTDVSQRSHGLKPEQEKLLWDSCVQTETHEGLISHIAHAMTYQKELFLVYAKSVGVIRKATGEEEGKIRADYKANGESKVGVYISFQHYRRTLMLEIYSGFEWCVLGSLNKSLNVAKSIQFKIADLRKSVSLVDSNVAVTQARSIAKAMGNGNDVLLDALDSVTSATPDTAPAEKAIAFLNGKRADILALPLSYIVGEQTPGIGSTGEADMRAVERGLQQYFVSIIRPVFKAIFDVDVEFKTQDFRQVSSGLEALKTFTLTKDEELISLESMQNISARMFDLDPQEEAKRLEKEKKAREDAAAKAKADFAKNPPPQQPNPANPNGGNPPAPGVNPAPGPAPQGGKA